MVKINRLTYLTFMLNSLVDTGLSLPLQEVKQLCQEGKAILEELEKRFPFKETGFDLSIFDAKTRKELNNAFEDMSLAINERRKFGVEKNGLCLIIAYAQELIQRGGKL